MRMLTQYEVDLVAGGTSSSENEIVVEGRWYYEDDGWGYNEWDNSDYGGGGGGGGGNGGEGGDATDFWGFVTWLMEQIAGSLGEATQRENAVGNNFDPAKIVSHSQQGSNMVWTMEDGSAFLDTNGNGRPDLQLKVDPGGHIWQNQGDGWNQTIYNRGY